MFFENCCTPLLGHSKSSPNATRDPDFRAFTKRYNFQWKVSKTFNSDPSKWRNIENSTGFAMFFEFRSTHILSSLNATRFPGFRAFTKCNKNQWKVTKTFKFDTSKWQKYQYFTGFIMFFEHCCTALFDHFKCPPKSRLSVAHEMH